jgi:TrmH family RNA methyltransferase
MKIALIETITPGNIGAVARVMKNFGFNELLLVKPKCNHLSEEAFQRACQAKTILKKAKVINEDELFKEFVVGTTSKASRRAHRKVVTPNNLEFLPEDAVLLFGREDNGLSNELLEKCDAVITIPTGTNYSSLNLSHSVAIILYELNNKKTLDGLASPKLKKALIELLYELSDDCDRDESLKGFLKNVINRSVIHKSEAKALMGFFKEIKKRLL